MCLDIKGHAIQTSRKRSWHIGTRWESLNAKICGRMDGWAIMGEVSVLMYWWEEKNKICPILTFSKVFNIFVVVELESKTIFFAFLGYFVRLCIFLAKYFKHPWCCFHWRASAEKKVKNAAYLFEFQWNCGPFCSVSVTDKSLYSSFGFFFF